MVEMEETDGPCLGKLKDRDNYNNHLSETDVNNTDINDVNNTNNNEDIAVAPIFQHDYYYKMDHDERGLLIIFNHQNFDEETRQPARTGTDKDVAKIKEAFCAVGFEIHVFNDMTLTEIRIHIAEYAKYDYYNKQRDCLAIFVLTHGNKDVLWARDKSYDPSFELWGRFTPDKCPSLAGKPKLIFLQACQGQAFDEGVMLQPPIRRQTEFDGNLFYTIPLYADFLIFHATFEGFFAFRNDVDGSFWVTVLCEELTEHYRKEDLLTILTFVNKRMMDYSSRNTKDETKHNKKQISYFKSSLTRLLVFGEK